MLAEIEHKPQSSSFIRFDGTYGNTPNASHRHHSFGVIDRCGRYTQCCCERQFCGRWRAWPLSDPWLHLNCNNRNSYLYRHEASTILAGHFSSHRPMPCSSVAQGFGSTAMTALASAFHGWLDYPKLPIDLVRAS